METKDWIEGDHYEIKPSDVNAGRVTINDRPLNEVLSSRELEELEVQAQKEALSGADIKVSICAQRIRDFFNALKAQGFSDFQAMEIVRVTAVHFLSRF